MISEPDYATGPDYDLRAIRYDTGPDCMISEPYSMIQGQTV